MEQSPTPSRVARNATIVSLFLVLVMFSSLFASLPENYRQSELLEESTIFHTDDIPVKLYNIYIDKRNSTAGGDGYLTTKTPNGDQSNESALTETLEFRTRNLLSDMPVGGRQASGGGGDNWEIPVSIYLRATAGSQGNTATYTFTLRIEDESGSSETISTAQKEQSACSDLFGCGWNQEIVRMEWIGAQYKTIPSGGALTLSISAESTCEGQSSNPFGGGVVMPRLCGATPMTRMIIQ
ncbi:MAG: hypothetical protein CMA77_00560 [Euryarchaeota archaeon]|nr:hypothetical protein [Euryarchaeota archaeon]